VKGGARARGGAGVGRDRRPPPHRHTPGRNAARLCGRLWRHVGCRHGPQGAGSTCASLGRAGRSGRSSAPLTVLALDCCDGVTGRLPARASLALLKPCYQGSDNQAVWTLQKQHCENGASASATPACSRKAPAAETFTAPAWGNAPRSFAQSAGRRPAAAQPRPQQLRRQPPGGQGAGARFQQRPCSLCVCGAPPPQRMPSICTGLRLAVRGLADTHGRQAGSPP
jgi:hypothetical protein